MNWIKQTLAVTWMNLRNLRSRLGPSSVIVIGIAGVVAVLTALLAMAEGFQRTLEGAGRADHAIVLRDGANDELSSGIGGNQPDLIATLPGIARDADGNPLVSAEVYVVSDVPKRKTGLSANLTVRGVTAMAPAMRENFELLEGRMIEPGRAEMIAGRGAASQFADLDLGSVLQARGSEWTVVGIFSTGGDVYESEVWVDAPVAQSAFRRGNSYQSVRVALEDEDAFAVFTDGLDADQRLQLKARRESEHFSAQSAGTAGGIRLFGYAVCAIMAIGAIFGALNSMYSAVSTRSVEIATLRALGFRGSSVVVSVLVESLALAFAGGAIGAGLAYLVFNGYTVSTLNNASFSQVAFDFAVTPQLMIGGIVIALVLGFFGGLLPSLRAARIPITEALREL